MARTPKYYHHGSSPAAWTGVVITAIGFVLGAIGSVMGPNWALVFTGAAIVLVGGLTVMVMKTVGLGQP